LIKTPDAAGTGYFNNTGIKNEWGLNYLQIGCVAKAHLVLSEKIRLPGGIMCKKG